MKIYLAALSLIFSFWSPCVFARGVGDEVTYEGTYTKNGVTQNLSISKRITAFDSDSHFYTVGVTRTLGSQLSERIDQVQCDASLCEIPSEQVSEVVAQNCPPALGVKEEIEIKAGKFVTCHITANGDQVWVAGVPFGYAKFVVQSDDGATSSLVLSSFHRAP